MSEREMRHFESLSYDERCAAIHQLAQSGLSDYSIANATRLAVEQIRRILLQQNSEVAK
jgi:hypothetical protein